MRADRVVIAVATPLGVALLYFLFAGEVSVGEEIACAPVVVVASLYARALARSETVAMQVTARGLGSLLRGSLAVVPDCWRVGCGLMKAGPGAMTRVPFRFGGPGRDDVGRRAAVVAGMSLAPNGFVVGQDGDELIVHQLAPGPVGGDPEWPL